MSIIEVNGMPGIKINARKLNETPAAILLDCEGDKFWFPKQHVKYDEKTQTAIIAEWLYNAKFK